MNCRKWILAVGLVAVSCAAVVHLASADANPAAGNNAARAPRAIVPVAPTPYNLNLDRNTPRDAIAITPGVQAEPYNSSPKGDPFVEPHFYTTPSPNVNASPFPNGPSPNPSYFVPVPQSDSNANAPSSETRRDDPEMDRLEAAESKLERHSQQLAEEFRRAPADKQDRIKKELEDIVSRQFDVRQERRNLELKRLEDEASHLRDSIGKRQANKQQIVEHRMSEILGKDDTSF